MKAIITISISFIAVTTVSILASCGNRTQIESCKIIEIEDAEVEFDLRDIDIERGEVEMVCGDKIIDVTWGEFRSKLRINPGRYKNNLEGFKGQISCIRDDTSRRKEVFCKAPGYKDDFIALNFSYDD
ncbi:MAG: hypothetical protein QNJ49_22490 [Mastigocoleus sp. MO_167.B18]|nr:hypothetical protein [Mastigocoleus sp. MO_167.B18]